MWWRPWRGRNRAGSHQCPRAGRGPAAKPLRPQAPSSAPTQHIENCPCRRLGQEPSFVPMPREISQQPQGLLRLCRPQSDLSRRPARLSSKYAPVMRPLWPTLDRKSTYPAVQFCRTTSDHRARWQLSVPGRTHRVSLHGKSNHRNWVAYRPAVFVDFDALAAVLSAEEACPLSAGQSPKPDSRLPALAPTSMKLRRGSGASRAGEAANCARCLSALLSDHEES